MYKELFYTEDLENEMDELVFMELRNVIDEEKVNFCRCKLCIQDIAAIALNNLRPKYSSNKIERNYMKHQKRVDTTLQMRVKNEVYRAIDLVNKRPHH